MYKGYLRGNGKHAATSFKNGENLIAYHTARKYDSFVGVLEDDYIMVDIDDMDDADIIFEILEDKEISFSALETDNGIHFYFKGYDLPANRIKWYSNIGILTDYKLGSRNTVDPLRINGKTRRWLKRSNEPDALPQFLYPMSRKDPGLTSMRDGDGRNDKLFTYILKLQSQGMAKNDIKETITIINDYILKEPVSKRELNTILRDEAFMKQSFFIKNSFQHQKFGDFLINEHHIIKITNILHIYKDGVYSDNQQDIEAAMIKHIPNLKRMQRQETLAYLQLKAEEKEFSPAKYIVVENGVFNLDTWELEEHSPNIITRNKIPVPYVPGAYYEVTDKTLDKIAVNDKKVRMLLEEILGYVLFRRNEYAAMFILTGDGSNGKSSFLDMLRKFVGSENTSALDLNELDHRFKTAELFGKLVNIGDDIDKSYIKSTGTLKKLATGNAVNVERKGRDPFDLVSYAKLIFSANEMPRINDYTDGLNRRLQIVPFKAKFTPDDPDYDPFITDKLLSDESMQYILNLALNALKRLLKNNRFTRSKAIEKEMEMYMEENNPIISFVNNEGIEFDRRPVKNVYEEYRIYCNENGFQAVSNVTFGRQIRKLYGYTSKQQRVDGENVRIYVKN